MTLKRVLGFTISLLELILIASMFFPYGEEGNIFTVFAPYSYIIAAYAGVGLVLGIIGVKVQANFLSAGSTVMVTLATIIQFIQADIDFNLPVGFIILTAVSVFLLAATFVYSFFEKPTGHRIKKRKNLKEVPNNGIAPQQMTNSLNMNMPVNNYQSLPVTMTEKQKAPMDVLLAGKDNPVPLGSTVVQGAGVQSHMAELGLTSINITQDNPTGAMPMPMPGMPPQPMPAQQPAPAPQPMPAQPAMPQQAPQPMQQMPQKPDLLAGSSMSGQLDSSPYNAQPVQPGQGQFF